MTRHGPSSAPPCRRQVPARRLPRSRISRASRTSRLIRQPAASNRCVLSAPGAFTGPRGSRGRFLLILTGMASTCRRPVPLSLPRQRALTKGPSARSVRPAGHCPSDIRQCGPRQCGPRQCGPRQCDRRQCDPRQGEHRRGSGCHRAAVVCTWCVPPRRATRVSFRRAGFPFGLARDSGHGSISCAAAQPDGKVQWDAAASLPGQICLNAEA